MDAEYASVARDSLAAALLGQIWVDAEKSGDEWEHKYYTAINLLMLGDAKAWRAIQETVNTLAQDSEARIPSTTALRRGKKKFRKLLEEVGIELFPLTT